ncbi:MAG TPA: hypothetical protein VHM89_08500 [Acidimicrobiales bacterium]|nr:hypothetical protein [Acidimicrobiales bacterium]
MTGPEPDPKSPVARAVDLLIHAPLGVLVTARDELPRLIAKGRQEATGARFVGKMAVDMGHREAGKLVRQATERLADLGLVPDPRRASQAAGEAPDPPSTAEADAGAPPDAATPAAAGPAPADEGSSAAEPPLRPPADALAIPGYDSLSAPHVVQRLDGLSDEELEAVRLYESATRGRKTILSRIAQIQTGS